MYGLMAQNHEGSSQAIDVLCNSREMAFVITDLEGSTVQASANAAAFGKVQEIHDSVRPLCQALFLPVHAVRFIFMLSYTDAGCLALTMTCCE
jgi:hypothetical protein